MVIRGGDIGLKIMEALEITVITKVKMTMAKVGTDMGMVDVGSTNIETTGKSTMDIDKIPIMGVSTDMEDRMIMAGGRVGMDKIRTIPEDWIKPEGGDNMDKIKTMQEDRPTMDKIGTLSEDKTDLDKIMTITVVRTDLDKDKTMPEDKVNMTIKTTMGEHQTVMIETIEDEIPTENIC